ncbi:MAG TPA: GNAT family N-acetyltransferase [Solirubrobacteraceae bacterium]|nr:GNAT family N-acetyltransferase [Solirubrobacteraceae bacterium]
MAPPINSLVWATDVDVLAPDHTLERRAGYWVVQSPGNPTFWWGNFLLFDDAPAVGDGERWQGLFAQEFAARPEVTHCTLAWDRVDGEAGAAEHELVAHGFELEWTSGLIAKPERIQEHPAASTEVEIRALDPVGDEQLWEAVVALQMAGSREEFRESEYHLNFTRARQGELRAIFSAGRGGWYVALLGGAIAGSLGIVVTDTRARFQTVDTVERFRRRGVARRLVYEAARDACSKHAIDHFVIAADPDYHAIGIYEGLGFERVELVVGAMRKPAGS